MPRRAPATCRSTATLKPPCSIRSLALPLASLPPASPAHSRPLLPFFSGAPSPPDPLPPHRHPRRAITLRATPYAQQPNPPIPTTCPYPSYIRLPLARYSTDSRPASSESSVFPFADALTVPSLCLRTAPRCASPRESNSLRGPLEMHAPWPQLIFERYLPSKVIEFDHSSSR